MTERERLVELLKDSSQYIKEQDGLIEIIADYLLDNGVIVPPVKVGQTVWFPSKYYDRPYPINIMHLEVYEEETLIYSEGGSEWHYEDIGKIIFLTQKEAERELERRKG